MTDEALEAWSTLVAVYQAVLHDVVGALGEQAGIDSGVFSTLAYLERADPPHRMRMSDLQGHLHPRYSQPGFSRLVQRMESERLVERRPDTTDGRAAILVATRRGRVVYERANAVYNAAVHEHFGRHLTRAEGVGIRSVLGDVVRRRGAAPRPSTVTT